MRSGIRRAETDEERRRQRDGRIKNRLERREVRKGEGLKKMAKAMAKQLLSDFIAITM
jgi:F0F1-type ATP synthase assembly protein I